MHNCVLAGTGTQAVSRAACTCDYDVYMMSQTIHDAERYDMMQFGEHPEWHLRALRVLSAVAAAAHSIAGK